MNKDTYQKLRRKAFEAAHYIGGASDTEDDRTFLDVLDNPGVEARKPFEVEFEETPLAGLIGINRSEAKGLYEEKIIYYQEEFSIL